MYTFRAVPEEQGNRQGSEPPPLVAEHELLRRVGVGAYGEVWLARNATGMPRAVKVIRRDRFGHERIYEREFTGLKHFEPISRLHPGLVDVLQVGRSEGATCFYYVMELADPAGADTDFDVHTYVPLTLGEMLRVRGLLPVEECARIGAAVADALGFLHGRGLVHRDIKPSNIILVGGQPKLADLGLVAGLDEARSFVGTEGYIPPEGPGSARADVYALGKVLYEMATGRSRLDFPDLPPDWRDHPEPERFAELNETILRACATEAKDRHGSAGDLRNELLLVEAGRSVRRLRRGEQTLARWRRIGAVAAGVGLLSLGAVWFERAQVVRATARATQETALRERIEAQERAARTALYAADMNLVQQAIAAGNYGRAETLLEAHQPRAGIEDVRGFEWFHFRDRVRGSSLGVLRGHEEVVAALAVSGDGRRLHSASFDGTLREWCLETLREERTWSWPGSILSGLAGDARGNRLAVELDKPPRTAVLEVGTGGWHSGPGHGSPGIVFSPEGNHLLRGVGIVLFETNAVTEIVRTDLTGPGRLLERSGGRAWFSPDGRHLVTGPWGDTLRLWSWPELEPLGDLNATGTVMAAAFCPEGERLATGSRQGRLQLWDLAGRHRLQDRPAHGGAVIWSVAFSPDGRRLVSTGNDQTVRLWDAVTLEEREVFRGHGSEVWTAAWTPDGRRIVSAGKDTTIRLWNVEPQPPPFEWTGVAQAPVFSPDDRWLALRISGAGVSVIDPVTGTGRIHLGPAIELGGFSPDGRTLSLLRPDGTVERRALEDGRLVAANRVSDALEPATARLLSPSGRWLILGTEEGTLRAHDVWGGGPPRRFEGHDQRIFSLEISRDEQRLLSGSRDLTARLWDLETGRQLAVLAGHRMSVSALAFAADDGRVATGSWDDTVRLWDVDRGLEPGVYGDHSAGVHAVAFSPDDRTLAVLSGGAELRFWNLASGREAGILTFDTATGLGRLQFSPQGNWLAVVSPGGRLTLLPAPRPPSGESPEFR